MKLREPDDRTQSRSALMTARGLMLLASLLMIYVVWPFRVPLFLAAVLAASFQPALYRLEQRLRGRRRLAAMLITLGSGATIVTPIIVAGAFAAQYIVMGIMLVRGTLDAAAAPESVASMLSPEQAAVLRLLKTLHVSPAQFAELVARYGGQTQQGMTQALAASSQIIAGTCIMLAAFYFLLLDGPRLGVWLLRVSPLRPQQTEELMLEIRKVASAAIVNIGLTALVQGGAAGIGYALTRVPNAIFFGLMTGLASFVPVVGTALIWVPAVSVLWLGGHHFAAGALLAWTLIFVVGLEQVGKTIIMRGQVQIPMGLMLLSLLGGLAMFGFIGMVIGPLIVAFFLSMLRIYARDFSEYREEPL
jgi:predicted PurR-regulated permease PerM